MLFDQYLSLSKCHKGVTDPDFGEKNIHLYSRLIFFSVTMRQLVTCKIYLKVKQGDLETQHNEKVKYR